MGIRESRMATGDAQDLTVQEQELVGKLVATNFRNYAEKRLTALPPHVLARLAKLSLPPAEKMPASTEEHVAAILVCKKQVTAMSNIDKPLIIPDPPTSPPPKPPKVAEPDVPPTPEKAIPTKVADAASKPEKKKGGRMQLKPVVTFDVFKQSPTLSVVFFNTLKLRVDKEGLEATWDAVLQQLSNFDVIVLSEVRSSANLLQTRLHKVFERLNQLSKKQFAMVCSEPSGSSPTDKCPEIHVVMVKEPMIPANHLTHHEIEGLKMGHAPFTVVVETPQFGVVEKVAITSVHLPPDPTRDKRSARDQQATKLFTCYSSEVRQKLNLPFTSKGAKDAGVAPVPHIITGDFNADGSVLASMGADDSNGWQVGLGKSVSTSSGGKGYDNFVVSKSSTFDMFALSYEVLRPSKYANFAARQDGVSDHAAVSVKLSL